MGSHNFSTYVDITKAPDLRDAKAAYRFAVEQAEFEHGHDGSNGTISTTHGVTVVQRTPVSQAEANAIVDAKLDTLEKWGPCGAIAIGRPVIEPPSRTITVTLTDLPLRDADGTTDKQVRAAASAQLQGRERVVTYKTTKDDLTFKVATTRTKGKAVLKYRFGSEFFDTLPQAISAAQNAHSRAITHAEEMTARYGTGYTPSRSDDKIEAVKVIDVNGVLTPALATVGSVLTKRVTTYTVTVAEPAGEMTHIGWLFFGWAAS